VGRCPPGSQGLPLHERSVKSSPQSSSAARPGATLKENERYNQGEQPMDCLSLTYEMLFVFGAFALVFVIGVGLGLLVRGS